MLFGGEGRSSLLHGSFTMLWVKQSVSLRSCCECGVWQSPVHKPMENGAEPSQSAWCRLTGCRGYFRRLGVNPAGPAFEHLDTSVREELEREVAGASE